jgi:hypothetical protein
MTTDVRTLTLRERLALFPPFLCFNLTRVRLPSLTKDELRKRLWNRKSKRKRKQLKDRGITLRRRCQYRRITVDEVAARFTKETRWYVAHLVYKLTWKDVQVGDALTFLDACGIDILHIKEVRRDLRNGLQNGHAIDHLSQTEKDHFKKLVRKWKKTCAA